MYPLGRGIWWPRGVQCKITLTFWRMQVRMHWIHRQLQISEQMYPHPPGRGIWWSREVLHKVILTCWRMQLRMHCIHSYCKISDKMYPWQAYPPPIYHTYMQHHYTTQVPYIAECTYTHARHTSPLL